MILVTGASGLLGSHVVYALLKKGKQVKAMVRSMHAKQNIAEVFSYYEKNADELMQKIIFVEGDVTDYFSIEQALENVTQVYHCAAYVSFNDDDFEQLQKVNYEGTANVANACLEAGVRLCHVSSVAALGEAKIGPAVSETDFWSGAANKSAYSISKYNAEREVWRAIEEGLNGFIINPSLIIGAGNWGKSSSAMLVSASKGMRFKTPGKTGFVDVRDVAQTAIALMESEVKKERFIINAGNYSFTEFYTHAAAVFNTQKPSINLPEFIAKIGLFFLRVASVFGYKSKLTKSAIRSAYAVQQFSNEKVKKQLQFEFIPFQESVVFASKLYKERN